MRKRKNLLYSLLCWVTNNEEHPKNEVAFDIFFFILNTIALIVGTIIAFIKNEILWIPFLVIEWSWALDNMRNNREYVKDV